jgi:ABC-type antimicrobial peptide transport system permease subunit
LLASITASLEARFGAGSLLSSPISPRIDAFMQAPRFLLMLLLGLGITAIVISTMAVFVMTTIAAGLRRHEIAVRVAMGASLRHVVRLFSRSELGTCLVGLLLGLPIAYWFGRLLQAFVIEAPATSHASYVLAGLVVFVVVVAASGQSVLRFHRRLRRTIQHELAGTNER